MLNNNNNNFQEEEDIKEEIEADYNDFETDENVLKNVECTYDKFLLESCAFDGKKQNEYHNLLKNQMKNIISDIKEKNQENHLNQINAKKKIFKDFENILNGNKIPQENNNYNNFNAQFNKKNYEATFNPQFNNINNQNNNENIDNINNDKNVNLNNEINHQNSKEKEYNLDSDNNDKLIESSDSKSYNINIDDFIKDNTMNEDIVNNVGNNSYLLNNNNNKNIYNNNNNYNNNYNNNININNNNNNNNNYNNNNNNKFVNNKNNDNNYNTNKDNKFNNNNNYNNNNKNFIYTLKDDPEQEKIIQENLNAFKKYNNIQKKEKNSDRFTSLYSNPRYLNNNNNNNNNNVIYVDDCKNSAERKLQQKYFDEMKQKKLKQLEERIQKNRSRSKPKIATSNKNNSNLIDQSDYSINNNKTIKKRPTTANTKKIVITAHNNNNNKNKNRPSTAKSNNLLTPANNLSNLTNNTTINSNYSHISTRVPVKITREQSKIANKKVKNVKYNKMSNKNSIKKAIAEVCLAGVPNKDYREQILKIIDNCSCENYIILFRNYGRFDLKAVYTYDNEKDYIELLTCINNAPDFLENEQIFKFYKFNMAKNQFSELNGIKNFSVIVDGICIKN